VFRGKKIKLQVRNNDTDIRLDIHPILSENLVSRFPFPVSRCPFPSFLPNIRTKIRFVFLFSGLFFEILNAI